MRVVMTTCWPGFSPDRICVVLSPTTPVVTGVTTSLPFVRTVTVVCPPLREIAVEGTLTAPSAWDTTTWAVAVMPGFSCESPWSSASVTS